MTGCSMIGCTKTFDRIDRFPHIRSFALEIAYDNGMINVAHPEDCFLAECDAIMGADGMYDEDHARLDDWLATLSQDELETLAAGEETEMNTIRERCPRGGPDNVPLCNIGNDFFESPLP